MIIDEISMVCYQTFTFIHRCLTEIKGTDDTEVHFGGISTAHLTPPKLLEFSLDLAE